jgi:beta-lactamase class D
VRIVKEIMIQKETASFTLRAKTGWSSQSGMEIGWYIGYIEARNNVYYFSNCVQLSSDLMNQKDRAENFIRSRKDIAVRILNDLDITEEEIILTD